VTRPTRALFADLLASPGVEEVLELRSRFGFLAFHGGLEGGTETIARAAAHQADASVYAVIQPDQLRWHVPSHEVTGDVSDKLAAFLDHVDVAIAVHGYGRPDRPNHLLLGGRNRDLASHVACSLRATLAGYEIIDDLDAMPAEIRGLHPRNPVNRPRQGGVQLELPPRARGTVPAGTPSGQCTPVAGLVDALAQAAATWSAGGGDG
jgi:phage replication-related protein YjqB (UPF0714/DUF867 family)